MPLYLETLESFDGFVKGGKWEWVGEQLLPSLGKGGKAAMPSCAGKSVLVEQGWWPKGCVWGNTTGGATGTWQGFSAATSNVAVVTDVSYCCDRHRGEEGVKISVQKAVPNVHCAGAIPAAQPSWSMGRSTGGVGSDAAALPVSEAREEAAALGTQCDPDHCPLQK